MDINVSNELKPDMTGEKSDFLKTFKHKTFEERVAEYDGEISICDFNWGEPKGKEKLLNFSQ